MTLTRTSTPTPTLTRTALRRKILSLDGFSADITADDGADAWRGEEKAATTLTPISQLRTLSLPHPRRQRLTRALQPCPLNGDVHPIYHVWEVLLPALDSFRAALDSDTEATTQALQLRIATPTQSPRPHGT